MAQWLVKTEPDECSIDDLADRPHAPWSYPQASSVWHQFMRCGLSVMLASVHAHLGVGCCLMMLRVDCCLMMLRCLLPTTRMHVGHTALVSAPASGSLTCGAVADQALHPTLLPNADGPGRDAAHLPALRQDRVPGHG